MTPNSTNTVQVTRRRSLNSEPITTTEGLEAAYDKSQVLGEGTYGVVYEAVHKKTQRKVALKKIRLDSPEIVEEIGIPGTAIREILLLRDLQHPNVVSLLEVDYSGLQLWLVFEHCDKDLKKLIKKYMKTQKDNKAKRKENEPTSESTACSPNSADTGTSQNGNNDEGIIVSATGYGIPLTKSKSISYQLLQGLCYAHGRRVLHRDLKPQNLLLTENDTVLKVADFGLARTFTAPKKPNTQEVVTLWYRAPELILGDRCYGTALDMWSVGCIIIEILCGRPLFPGDSEVDTLFKVFRFCGTPNETIWPTSSKLPHFNSDFPRWSKDKNTSIQELLPHLEPDGVELISKLLEYEPAQRISADEALKSTWFDSVRDAEEQRLLDMEAKTLNLETDYLKEHTT